jgi:predicted transcriptional regulator
MKAVYRSIKPYWLYLVIIGQKTIEVGKTFPKAGDWNKEVFLHCSKDMKSFNRIPEKDREWMRKYLGKAACRFVCDDIAKIRNLVGQFIAEGRSERETNTIARASCLDFLDMKRYLGTKDGYAWHITDLVIYDTPKELSEFHKPIMPTGLRYEDDAITRPPQSWCYVEEVNR